MNVARNSAGQLRQLAAFPQDDTRDHVNQAVQMPRQVPTRFFWVKLLHGLFYGTMDLAAVTHGVAPILW
jgi:hypothetical protein